MCFPIYRRCWVPEPSHIGMGRMPTEKSFPVCRRRMREERGDWLSLQEISHCQHLPQQQQGQLVCLCLLDHPGGKGPALWPTHWVGCLSGFWALTLRGQRIKAAVWYLLCPKDRAHSPTSTCKHLCFAFPHERGVSKAPSKPDFGITLGVWEQEQQTVMWEWGCGLRSHLSREFGQGTHTGIGRTGRPDVGALSRWHCPDPGLRGLVETRAWSQSPGHCPQVRNAAP